ncbi:MAG TPA: insulinase family protein, partial [Polyangia bacterium]|nr:insulinase family protein [Polyangia bacterium]
ATFNTEREVVRNELRQSNETGFVGQGLDWMQEAIFPVGHAYHHGIAGTHGSLTAITFDDARRFVARHYRPDNMTMLVIGDVALEGAEPFVKQQLSPALYGDPQKAAVKDYAARVPATSPPVPQVKPAGPIRHQAAVTNPEIWIGWTIPGGFGSQSFFISQFWSSLVTGNFEAGTFADDPDIVSVSFAPQHGKQAGMLLCRISLTEGTHPQESAERVMKYLPWIDDEMYLGRRFLRLKAQAMRRRAFSAETIMGRAEDRALFTHFAGHPGYFATVMETIRNIDADVATTFAQRYLKREQAHVIIIEPLPPEKQQPLGTTGLGAERPDDSSSGEAPTKDARPLTPLSDRRLAGLRTARLPSGLELIMVRRQAMPIVAVDLGFRGSRLSAGSMAVADAAAIAIQLDGEQSPSDYGIAFGLRARSDGWDMRLLAGIDNLPRALDILSFSLKSFDVDWPSPKYSGTLLPFLRKREASPLARADRQYRRALFGDHPLGRSVAVDDVAKVNPADIKTWFKGLRAPQDAALVVAGDIDLDRTEALVRDALGGWQAASDPRLAATPPPLPPPAVSGALSATIKAVIVEDRPHATQVVLELGCLLPLSDERRDAVHDVLAAITRSQLHQLIRVQSGASYGVSASAMNTPGGTSHLTVTSAIDNAHIGSAMATIRDFVRVRSENGFLPGEIAKARFNLSSGYLLSAQDVGGLSAALLRRWKLGWSLESVDRYPDYLAAVTTEQVNAAMRACSGNQVLSLVGNQTVITAGLRQAGINPPAVAAR